MSHIQSKHVWHDAWMILGLTKLQEMKFALLEVAAIATPQPSCHVNFASTSVHIFHRVAEITKRCRSQQILAAKISSHVNQVSSIRLAVHHIFCCTPPSAVSHGKTTYDRLCQNLAYHALSHLKTAHDQLCKSLPFTQTWHSCSCRSYEGIMLMTMQCLSSKDAGRDTKYNACSSVQH